MQPARRSSATTHAAGGTHLAVSEAVGQAVAATNNMRVLQPTLGRSHQQLTLLPRQQQGRAPSAACVASPAAARARHGGASSHGEGFARRHAACAWRGLRASRVRKSSTMYTGGSALMRLRGVAGRRELAAQRRGSCAASATCARARGALAPRAAAPRAREATSCAQRAGARVRRRPARRRAAPKVGREGLPPRFAGAPPPRLSPG